MKKHLTIFLFSLLFIPAIGSNTIWVGQTITCDAASAMVGLISDVSWYGDGMLNMSGSGYYRDVKCKYYFGGIASVTCSWKYRLYSNDSLKSSSKTWTFTCYDNPVTLSPSQKTVYSGQEFQLSYGLTYYNTYSHGATFNFSTSNPLVASVTSSGKVVALSEGIAYINITSNASSNSPYCTVTVENADPASISLSPNPLEVTVDMPEKFTAILEPEYATSTLTWSSENDKIASVNSAGLVTGISVGKTKVTVQTSNGLTASADVIVLPGPTGVSLPDSLSIYVGYSTELQASLIPENSKTIFTWSSSNPSCLSVSSNGVIKGIQEGHTTVTVETKNGLSDTTEISVKAPDSSLSVTRINSKIKSIKEFANTVIKKIK